MESAYISRQPPLVPIWRTLQISKNASVTGGVAAQAYVLKPSNRTVLRAFWVSSVGSVLTSTRMSDSVTWQPFDYPPLGKAITTARTLSAATYTFNDAPSKTYEVDANAFWLDKEGNVRYSCKQHVELTGSTWQNFPTPVPTTSKGDINSGITSLSSHVPNANMELFWLEPGNRVCTSYFSVKAEKGVTPTAEPELTGGWFRGEQVFPSGQAKPIF